MAWALPNQPGSYNYNYENGSDPGISKRRFCHGIAMSSATSTRSSDQLLFTDYEPGPFYDELIAPGGEPRPWAAAMVEKLAAMPLEVFEERRKLADLSYLVQGITFTVYSDGRGTERLFPLRFLCLPHYSPFRVGCHRARSGPARDGAQPLSSGHLRGATGYSETASYRAIWFFRASISGAKWSG